MTEEALEYARDQRETSRQQLTELLRIPSVSTLPDHKGDIRRAADWMADYARRIGLENVELIETERHPIVYADWLHAEGKPTVLVYGHYDVQPPDPLEEWETPPFEPTVRDGKLYARGSSDDKGQVFAQLKAIESYLRTDGSLPVNVKLCIEGEEEIGSQNLPEALQAHHDRFAADVCVVSDSHMRGPEQPSIVYGLRGMVYGEIEVAGPSHDLHSGGYGGAVHNPMQAMCEILAALHDAEGRVTIPGFYDAVRELSEAERAEVMEAGVDESDVLTESGAPAIWGEPDYSVAERLGARPTLEIHGIRGGFTGEGAKTVIPAKALAKVSMRLAAHQTADEIAELFERHVESLAPATVRVSANAFFKADPALVERDHPVMEAAAQAYEASFGARPVFTLEGGSIPVVSLLQRQYGIPVVLMGFGLPDDRLHSPNEKFDLANFERGISCAIRFLDTVATHHG